MLGFKWIIIEVFIEWRCICFRPITYILSMVPEKRTKYKFFLLRLKLQVDKYMQAVKYIFMWTKYDFYREAYAWRVLFRDDI